MIISQAAKLAIKKFRVKNIKTASLDAEVLLSFVLKKPKEFLYAYPEKKLTATQLQQFKKLIARRAKLEPIAYLTNQQEFYGFDFYVDKRVLIPRPETELIVDEVLANGKSLMANRKLSIADIGTGSGCIAITLKKYLPQTTVYAVDISPVALTVAKKNADNHKVKINFSKSNLLQSLANKKIDIIIANLPYLTPKQLLPFEPKKALLGGKDGLEFYQKLFKQIAQLSVQPKLILCEIDPQQVSKIKKIAKQTLAGYQLLIKKDLSDLNRLIVLN